MKKATKRKVAEMGAGVLAATALAGAAKYFLSTETGKKDRKEMKAWAIRARREVAKNFEKAKKLNETDYKHLVAHAMKRYGSMEKVNTAEIAKATKDLKAEWKKIHAATKKPSLRKQKVSRKKK